MNNKSSYQYKIKNPLKDENVIYSFPMHWTMWLQAILPAIFSIFTVKYAIDTKSIVLTEFNIFLSIILILSTIYSILELTNTKYIVTNKRIIINTGYFVKEKTDIRIEQIESITAMQDIFGDMFGYGNIIFNHNNKNTFYNIKSPLEVKNHLSHLIENKSNINENI